MNVFQQPIFYALLMCVAGVGIPIMAALNGNLGAKLHSPALATTILFIVGGVVSLAYLLLSGGMPKPPIKEPIPMYFYFGGLFVIFYILSMTWVAPKFGVGNAISMVLLGQLMSMVVIDHYGLWGALKQTMSMQRLVGLAFMILGVYLTVRRI
ncbi:MAG: DMT family transporter [Colwellia sp.]|nr:DMT family transporter [Colwellia sp.]